MGEGNKYDRYDRDLERGLEYEDFVYQMLQKECGITTVRYASAKWQNEVGENAGGIEIKLNEQFAKTGNLWIETARKLYPEQQEYKASGICRPDNGWLFVTGTYEIIFIFSRRMLRGLMGRHTIIENNTKTSRGFLLSSKDAHAYAAHIIEAK